MDSINNRFDSLASDGGQGGRSRPRAPSALARFQAEVTVQVVETAVLLALAYATIHFMDAVALGADRWRLFVLISAPVLLALHLSRSYRFQVLRMPERAWGLFARTALMSAAFSGAILLLTDIGFRHADIFLAWGLVVIPTVAAGRFVAARLLARRLRSGAGDLSDRVAIYGWGTVTAGLVNRLADDPAVRLVGIYDERREPRGPEPVDLAAKVAFGGTGQDLVAAVRRGEVDRVVLGLPWHAEARLNTLMRLFATTPIRVDLCPEPILLRLSAPRFEQVGALPLLTAIAPPIEGWHLILKRAEDLVISSLALAGLILPLLVVGLLIRHESPGPALFRQVRTGFNNRPFTLLKFRTMYHGPVPDPGERQATKDDPRVTPIGRWLRATSIDELPQLWNVLMGDMSIVGPRPLSVPHNQKYSAQLQDYFGRHNVKPGITGWAQANGLRGEVKSDDVLRRWVEHDLHYVNNFSIYLDVKIIVLTLLRFWRQDTAY